MKTDQFNDEFRRKLLGLPADTDPGEVDRVQAYVQTHKPGIPGAGWGKLLFFGGAGLLLVTSLTYNFIQSYRNTHLQTTLDSLTQRSAQTEIVTKHNTVYVARQSAKQEMAHDSNAAIAVQPAREKLNEQLLSEGNKTYAEQGSSERILGKQMGATADESTSPPARSDQPTESLTKTSTPDAATKSGERIASPTGGLSTRPSDKSISSERKDRTNRPINPAITATNDGLIRPKKAAINSNKPTSSELINQFVERSTTRRLTSVGVTSTDPLALNTTTRKRSVGRKASEWANDPRAVRPGEQIAAEAILEKNQQVISLERIPNRQFAKRSTLSKLISARRVRDVPTFQGALRKTHRPWRIALPTLSIPKATYRIGVLGTGADDQLGAGLLTEASLNGHWSFQAGVKALYSQGFHYKDERDYSEHQHEDFRQKYAFQLPITSAIEDIRQDAVIAQIPIQLAYHYPLSQQWRLRFGIGTDLDLWVRSAVSYNYRENSRSSEENLTRLKTPAQLLTNITLAPSVEWYQKKWVVRAGPFISPQLRSVSYKPDDLSWGANVQVLYRLGK